MCVFNLLACNESWCTIPYAQHRHKDISRSIISFKAVRPVAFVVVRVLVEPCRASGWPLLRIFHPAVGLPVRLEHCAVSSKARM